MKMQQEHAMQEWMDHHIILSYLEFKMIYQSVVFAALLASANAFAPSPRTSVLGGMDFSEFLCISPFLASMLVFVFRLIESLHQMQ